MLVRSVTFLVWAAVAASAVAWGLQLFVRPPAAPPQTLVAEAGTAARGDLTRLLGADAPAAVATAAAPEPVADARYKLVGVVSPRSPKAAREGLALIAVDGKPPRAYRVGAAVEEGHVLQGVSPRGATLGPADGAALVALKLPPPAAAATGVLPPAGRGGAAPMPPPALPRPSPALPIDPTLPTLAPPDEAQEVQEAEPTSPMERDSRAPLR